MNRKYEEQHLLEIEIFKNIEKLSMEKYAFRKEMVLQYLPGFNGTIFVKAIYDNVFSLNSTLLINV